MEPNLSQTEKEVANLERQQKKDDRVIQIISKKQAPSIKKTVNDTRAGINKSLLNLIYETTVTRRLHEICLHGHVAAKSHSFVQQIFKHDRSGLNSKLLGQLKNRNNYSGLMHQNLKYLEGNDECFFVVPVCEANMKFGGSSVVTCGCFSYDSIFSLVKIDST